MIYNMRLLTLVCILAAISIVACKKDTNTTGSSEAALISFGPTGAMHGDTIRFFGSNLNQVIEIDFTGASVSSTDFVSQSSNEIHVIVPDGAEEGFVTLKTASADIVSKTKFNLAVAVVVTSITPEARPGEDITINGKYLNWVTSITFTDDKTVETFVSQSLNQLVVTVPVDAKTGTLKIIYGGTDPNSVETIDTLKVTLPAVTSFTPNPIKHQQNLTITGTNLDLTQKVLFTGVATPVTTFESQSATQLVVKVPAETQAGKITLVAASGVAVASADELAVTLPAITSLAPNPIDPLANLTITGTDLDLVSAITFAGVPNPVTSFVSQAATQLVVTVPDGVVKGKIVLSVLNSTLTIQSADNLEIKGDLPPPAPFLYGFYEDGILNSWGNWGWGGPVDFSNTEIVRDGTASIKKTYDGSWDAMRFGGGNISTSAYTNIVFSIFGTPGTGGKKISLILNQAWSSPQYIITVNEGEWQDISVPLAGMGLSEINDFLFQAQGWSGSVYIDHVGLR